MIDLINSIKPEAVILDACCGARQFWHDKNREDTIYMDIREGDYNWNDIKWGVHPDYIGDFRHMPFPDESFSLVVFDPPHIIHGTESGIMCQKYGLLNKNTWKTDIRKGLRECMRVCKTNGFVNFKWSETNIPITEIIPLYPCTPLYSQRRINEKSTVWVMFMKTSDKNQKQLEDYE